MFNPSLSKAQRQGLAGLGEQLAKALEPVAVQEPSRLGSLRSKLGELTAEVAEIERGAEVANLEEAAARLTNRRAQTDLIRGQIGELEAAHQREQGRVQNEAAEKIEAASAAAHALLREVAQSFVAQHKDFLTGVLRQYIVVPGSEANLVQLIGFHQKFGRAVRAFCESRPAPDVLQGLLSAALRCEDFYLAGGRS